MLFTSEKKREFLLLIALVFGLAAGIVWIRTSTVKATYTYVQHQKELVKLQQELQSVRVQWLKFTSPRQLDLFAAELGLTPPRMEQVMRYESSRSPAQRHTP